MHFTCFYMFLSSVYKKTGHFIFYWEKGEKRFPGHRFEILIFGNKRWFWSRTSWAVCFSLWWTNCFSSCLWEIWLTRNVRSQLTAISTNSISCLSPKERITISFYNGHQVNAVLWKLIYCTNLRFQSIFI